MFHMWFAEGWIYFRFQFYLGQLSIYFAHSLPTNITHLVTHWNWTFSKYPFKITCDVDTRCFPCGNYECSCSTLKKPVLADNHEKLEWILMGEPCYSFRTQTIDFHSENSMFLSKMLMKLRFLREMENILESKCWARISSKKEKHSALLERIS